MDLDTEELKATKRLYRRKKYKDLEELDIKEYSQKVYEMINKEEK